MSALELGRNLFRRIAARPPLAAMPSDHLLHRIDLTVRELRALLIAHTMPPAELWRNGATVAPSAPTGVVFDRSVICRQEHFETGYFTYWAAQMAHAPVYHRKLWEFVFIAQALHERGLLQDGSMGLGFGVGREPLTALFASRGCRILATDADGTHAATSGWAETAQHAASLDGLRWPQICNDDRFTRSVRFRPFDMNSTPGKFRDFDFCWSACALEHLGSIEKGLDFIRNSLACLRPGGVAVHTTEFNLGYSDQTLDNTGTVLFRRTDFETLFARLRDEGHQCAALDLTEGNQPVERYIDLPPFRAHPHLKLALEGIPTTSIGLIVHRRPE
jgi:SAM-dependent methyltransferase